MQSLSRGLLRRRGKLDQLRELTQAAVTSLVGGESPYLKHGSLTPVPMDYKPLLSATPETKAILFALLEAIEGFLGHNVAKWASCSDRDIAFGPNSDRRGLD